MAGLEVVVETKDVVVEEGEEWWSINQEMALEDPA